jgi:redox-sensitive bicupin YhaK (pirin superfamily)
MIRIRPAAERGTTRLDWLESYHSFSFGDYYDPAAMGFRSLRVINDDRIAPGGGFGMHGHRDMEIVTYMLSGSLAHQDSLGSGESLQPGDVQVMTAGRGIRHSEFNASPTEPAHLLQVWLLPERPGLPPSYHQRHFAAAEKQGRWRVIASRDGRDGSLVVHQDVTLLAALLNSGEAVDYSLAPGRHGWLQVARGVVQLNDQRLSAGDAAAVSDVAQLRLVGIEDADVLLFDLA